MKKWEYLLAQPEFTEPEHVQMFLNDRGLEGWELITVTQQEIASDVEGLEGFLLYTMFFKRSI
jgi:hypothetical protein